MLDSPPITTQIAFKLTDNPDMSVEDFLSDNSIVIAFRTGSKIVKD